MASRLRDRGVTAKEYNFSPASTNLLQNALAINDGKLRLYEAEGLREELLALRLVQGTAGAWGFDHKKGGHDDRVMALALMVTALLERPGGAATLHIPKGRIPGKLKGLGGGPDGGRFSW